VKEAQLSILIITWGEPLPNTTTILAKDIPIGTVFTAGEDPVTGLPASSPNGPVYFRSTEGVVNLRTGTHLPMLGEGSSGFKFVGYRELEAELVIRHR
jgi:hypothetical protein